MTRWDERVHGFLRFALFSRCRTLACMQYMHAVHARSCSTRLSGMSLYKNCPSQTRLCSRCTAPCLATTTPQRHQARIRRRPLTPTARTLQIAGAELGPAGSRLPRTGRPRHVRTDGRVDGYLDDEPRGCSGKHHQGGVRRGFQRGDYADVPLLPFR